MKTLVIWMMSFCIGCGLMAQEAVSFTVSAPDTVPPSEAFAVTFTLENEPGHNFTPPDWGRLSLVSGPSISQEFSNINGKVSRKQAYTFHIMATEEGVYNLYPASITIDGELQKTESQTIIVKEGYELPKTTTPPQRWKGWDWEERLPKQPKSTKKKKTYRI